MRRRYLIAWDTCPLSPPRVEALNAIVARSADLKIVSARPEMIILADVALPVRDGGVHGAILGTLFDRGARSHTEAVSTDLWENIRRSDGRLLIERFWGDYLALLPAKEGDRLDVVRAPFGDLGACLARDGNGWLIGSDAEIIGQASARRPSLDLAALARHLGAPELVGTETCLTGIEDIRGGDCVTLTSGGARREAYWSPWTFAARATGQCDVAEAVRSVRNATMTAVAAIASNYPRVVLFLSGGLDSSIVAACLAKAGRPFSGLNLVTDDRIGDERSFARITAAALGIELTEKRRDPIGIDFGRSLAAFLPRPMARAFNQESERRAMAEATRLGATAMVDGSGGDNVFCSHRSVAATADCLLTDGFGPTYRATARALSDLTGAALPMIFIQSVRRGWLRPARLRRRCDVDFLAPHFAAIAQARADHPWLVVPDGNLPGRAIHVSHLTAAQCLVESGSGALPLDRISPLMSQPVAEACLRVPSWMWFAPGHDRAVARRAFASDLPAEIVNRRTKGTPAPFIAEVLASRRAELKPFVLDGVLAAGGLFDLDALAQYFDDAAPARSTAFTRVLGLIDAEAWARCWT